MLNNYSYLTKSILYYDLNLPSTSRKKLFKFVIVQNSNLKIDSVERTKGTSQSYSRYPHLQLPTLSENMGNEWSKAPIIPKQID